MEENFSSVKEMVEWLNAFANTQNNKIRDKILEISITLHTMNHMINPEDYFKQYEP